MLIDFFLEFLLNGQVLHGQLNADNGTILLENLYQLLFLIVRREVPHDDCPMIKNFVSKFITSLELNFTIV